VSATGACVATEAGATGCGAQALNKPVKTRTQRDTEKMERMRISVNGMTHQRFDQSRLGRASDAATPRRLEHTLLKTMECTAAVQQQKNKNNRCVA